MRSPGSWPSRQRARAGSSCAACGSRARTPWWTARADCQPPARPASRSPRPRTRSGRSTPNRRCRERVEGTVRLEFVIEADGRLGDLRVVVTPHPDLAGGGDCVRPRLAFHASPEGRNPRRRRRDDGHRVQAREIDRRHRERFTAGGCYTPAVPDPAAAPSSQDVCPLCGGPNDCGLAAGADTCWCFTASIPAAALERVPDEARDRTLHLRRLRRSDRRGQTGRLLSESLSRCPARPVRADVLRHGRPRRPELLRRCCPSTPRPSSARCARRSS